MAVAIEKKLNKTAFIKKILRKNPKATHAVVVEAWTKAGHPGSISETLVKMTRSDLGLTGNTLSRPDATTAPSKNGSSVVGSSETANGTGTTPVTTKRHSRDQGKSLFVKEFLFDNRKANAQAVNEAWQAAGMTGTISDSLVNSMRSQLGLTKKRQGTVKTAVNPVKSNVTQGTPTQKTRSDKRDRVLSEVEGDLDRIIFKLIGVGGLLDIEDALRTIRRKVIRRHEG